MYFPFVYLLLFMYVDPYVNQVTCHADWGVSLSTHDDEKLINE